MQATIKSKIFQQKITFSRPGNYYIFVDLNNRAGTQGLQICKGGALSGDTLGYDGDDEKEFKKLCQKWYRTYISHKNICY